jgi:hypothetical protein
LLRIAALEKAAHIVNTSSPNRVDFQGLARVIAEQVFGERTVRLPDRDGHPIQGDAFQKLDEAAFEHFVYPVEVSPWQKDSKFLVHLQEAARYGGTEFLDLLINASKGLAERAEKLPDPIDPTAILKRAEEEV